jgi:3-oxoacyl-[acyl-carrier protein] reductase
VDPGLDGRVVLVTGASLGIGRATALAFGAEGARVAVGYRMNIEAAEEIAATIRSTPVHPPSRGSSI